MTHEDYQKRFFEDLALLLKTEKSGVVLMDKLLSKLYLLNLDNLLPVIKPLFFSVQHVGLKREKLPLMLHTAILSTEFGWPLTNSMLIKN